MIKSLAIVAAVVATAMACSDFLTVENAFPVSYSTSNGRLSTVSYQCEDGSVPSNNQVVCKGNEWGAVPFSCQRSECSEPPKFEDERMSVGGYSTFNNQYKYVTVMCSENGSTFRADNAKVECNDGKWDKVEASCGAKQQQQTEQKSEEKPSQQQPEEVVPTGDKDSHEQADVVVPTGCSQKPYVAGAYAAGWGSNRQGKYAKYQCTAGDLVGENTIWCRNNKWDTPTFTCQGGVRNSKVVKKCGPEYTDSVTFTKPRPMSEPQCVDGVTGPASLCLTNSDDNAKLLPVPVEEVVKRHNCWRDHAIPTPKESLKPLVWDDELARVAERYVGTCPSGHDEGSARALAHRNGTTGSWDKVGQNICYSSDKQSWSKCVDNWSMEVVDFEYGVGPNGGKTGHYTQVVATESVAVGCGWAECNQGGWKFIQICNYGRAGNFKYPGWDDTKTPYEI